MYHSFIDENGNKFGSFEVFYDDADFGHGEIARNYDSDGNPVEDGYYWWPCAPGCLPDCAGDPSGPFETEAEAIADARGY